MVSPLFMFVYSIFCTLYMLFDSRFAKSVHCEVSGDKGRR